MSGFVPKLFGNYKKFNIWSAPCATGEEAYSIAFYLSEHFPIAAGWDWRIHATDVSTKALNVAQKGVYQEERLSSLPVDWWRKYFQKGQQDFEGCYRVKQPLMDQRNHPPAHAFK